MMRVFAWRQPRALLMLIVLLPGINAIAWAEAPRPYDKTVPVTKSTPARSDDNQFWLSLGTGAAVVSTYSGLATNIGIYGSSNGFVYGLRQTHARDVFRDFDCALASKPCEAGNFTESALMLGGYLDQRRLTWAAIGIARMQGTGEHSPTDQRVIEAGLPVEFVFSPHGRYAGFEVRLNGDLNQTNPFAMLIIGLRLGQLK